MSTAFVILVAGPVLTVMAAALIMIVGFILTTFVGFGEAIAVRAHERRVQRAGGPWSIGYHTPAPHF